MKVIFLMFTLILISVSLNGQYFLELHSEFDDSFREWEIILEKDSTEISGDLRLTWGVGNDWSEWQYRVGDYYGEISQKFKNNPGFWELRSDDLIVNIRQVWPGDSTEWSINCGKRTFTFRTLYTDQLDDWAMVEPQMGELILYTETRGDARDWIVSDFTIDEINFEERMAAIFIGLYTSIPKH